LTGGSGDKTGDGDQYPFTRVQRFDMKHLRKRIEHNRGQLCKEDDSGGGRG
jgi:hypothetical protein